MRAALGAVVANDGFDFSPGAQVPLTGAAGQTAATHALASAAYRDTKLEEFLSTDNEWHKTTVKGPKLPFLSLFQPNLGEAFARAVQVRLLGGARKPLIQSFGTEPQTVVEHCLAATRIRRARDAKLTIVMVISALLFLPGTLLWLTAFQVRRSITGPDNRRATALGSLVLFVAAGLSLLCLIKPPLPGLWGMYMRIMVIAPVLGWWVAKRICERSAEDMRARWESLLTGGGLGPKIPEAVPQDPNHTSAERLRKGLAQLTAEQNSNLVFYAGPKGILGMGTRWGSWHLAEELVSREPGKDFNPFRSWDVIRAIHDQLRMLERGPLHTGGFPKPSVAHWVVSPIGEGAKEVTRPNNTETDAYRIKGHEIQRICNEQQFGSGNRHYLGVQFVLWDGQLVLTFLVTVTVLHKTLRIEVTGHALGPVHSLFTTKPEPEKLEVTNGWRFWETKEVIQPLVKPAEVVRLAVRAPFTWFPPFIDFLGGKVTLPEPFGLRHAWASQPWRHRFMADDALRAATPVLRSVHAATMRMLEENGVDTEAFGTRSAFMGNLVQDVEPKKADIYNA